MGIEGMEALGAQLHAFPGHPPPPLFRPGATFHPPACDVLSLLVFFFFSRRYAGGMGHIGGVGTLGNGKSIEAGAVG